MTFNQTNYLWLIIVLAALISQPYTFSAAGERTLPVTITADWAGYGMKAGPWWVYTNPWNKGSLVNRVDYTQSITVIPETMPNGTVIAWSWPNQIPDHVYAGPFLCYGVYADGHTAAGIRPLPKQISTISILQIQHNVSISGYTNNFDVIYDGYLTATPGGDYHGVPEISIFVHSPPGSLTFNQSLSPRYSGYVDADGMAWDMAWHNSQIAIWPHTGADVLVNTIDRKAMLDYLIAQGQLTGNEWFNGIAIAAEPLRYTGTLTVNSISVTYN